MDRMVTATLNATRAKYQEGIMTYGNGRWLHHYLTMKNTETEIIRGDQQLAVQELYALLLHTSSTQAGFEYCILPWGDRDFANNVSPHGWFAAKFRAALRNMMVREQGNDLHLLSVISPEWVKPGDVITVKRAPTDFGQVNLEFRSDTIGATLVLDNHFSSPSSQGAGSSSQSGATGPQSIVLHLPWFTKTSSVVADDKPMQVVGTTVKIPISARRVRLNWARLKDAPDLSYARAVTEYKAEYRHRYEQWQRTGQPAR
jgi:hypothetical protein